jgi:hypothetical protein
MTLKYSRLKVTYIFKSRREEKYEEKRPLKETKHTQKENFKINLKNMCGYGLNSTG